MGRKKYGDRATGFDGQFHATIIQMGALKKFGLEGGIREEMSLIMSSLVTSTTFHFKEESVVAV